MVAGQLVKGLVGLRGEVTAADVRGIHAMPAACRARALWRCRFRWWSLVVNGCLWLTLGYGFGFMADVFRLWLPAWATVQAGKRGRLAT